MSDNLGIPRPLSLEQYDRLDDWLRDLRLNQGEDAWILAMRWLVVNDLFFLLTRCTTYRNVVNRNSGKSLFRRKFIMVLCKLLESPMGDNSALVAGRGMGKSTIRRLRKLQRRLADPESSGVYFSYELQAAEAHNGAIRQELESNALLKYLFPDRLYQDPAKESPVWSDQEFCLKRRSTRIENSFEARNFERLPTGKHYDDIDWDDVEDDRSVAHEEAIQKLRKRMSQSMNLRSQGCVINLTGTFYHPQGVVAQYTRLAAKLGGVVGVAPKGIPRHPDEATRQVYSEKGRMPWSGAIIYPGEDLSRPGEGPLGGTPIYYSLEELWAWWHQLNDPEVYAMQIACSLTAGVMRVLDSAHLGYYDLPPEEVGKDLPIYVCIDPSKGEQDPSACMVWANGGDRKHRLVDGFEKRITPQQLNVEVLNLVNRWSNIGNVIEVRVEEFGQANYVAPMKEYLSQNNVFMSVVKCHDTRTSKVERAYSRWEPRLRQGRILLPRSLITFDEAGRPKDLVRTFIENELDPFPRPMTDNLLDAGGLLWEDPDRYGELLYGTSRVERYSDRADDEHFSKGRGFLTWM